MIKKKQINIISTGGTIEKIYDEKNGFLDNKGLVVKNIICSKFRLPFTEIVYHELMAKDSLDLTDQDREKIFIFVKDLEKKRSPIVILHGTDTLSKTMNYFEEKKLRLSIPVIFTGAMRPIGFIDSDATQNLTEALMVAKVLDPGIYLSFHNQLIKGAHFKKNYDLGTFEVLS